MEFLADMAIFFRFDYGNDENYKNHLSLMHRGNPLLGGANFFIKISVLYVYIQPPFVPMYHKYL